MGGSAHSQLRPLASASTLKHTARDTPTTAAALLCSSSSVVLFLTAGSGRVTMTTRACCPGSYYSDFQLFSNLIESLLNGGSNVTQSSIETLPVVVPEKWSHGQQVKRSTWTLLQGTRVQPCKSTEALWGAVCWPVNGGAWQGWRAQPEARILISG